MLIAARALQALGGSGGIVLARAIVRDLYSGARAGRELSLIGVGDGAGAGAGADDRRRAADRLRLALGLRRAGRRRALSASAIVWLLLPETLAQRAAEPVSPVVDAASPIASSRATAAYLAYLGLGAVSYAGLFAWISGASFVLQNLYGLSPFAFGVAFALGSVGYMTGSTIAARLVGTARPRPHHRLRRRGAARPAVSA